MNTPALYPIRKDFAWESLLAAVESGLPLTSDMRIGQSRHSPSAARNDSRMDVRITFSISPALDRCTRLVQQVLGLGSQPELWVYPGSTWDLELIPATNGNSLCIRACSAIFSDLTLDEAMFLIGRAVSPSLTRTTTNSVARALVGDQVGLLCCQDLDAALRMLLRESTGLARSLLSATTAPLVEESREILARRGLTHRQQAPNPSDWLHERVVSLHGFAHSHEYQTAFVGTPIDLEGVRQSGPEEWTTHSRAEIRPPSVYHLDDFVESHADQISPAPVDNPLRIPNDSVQWQVYFQPVDGDPSVVEQVIRFHSGPTDAESATLAPLGTEQAESRDAADPVVLRRQFSAPAAFWLLALKENVSDRLRAVVEDLFGPEVFDEMRPLYAKGGEASLRDACLERASGVVGLEQGIRFDILRELCRIAMIDESHPAPFQPALTELTELLDLAPDDLAMALSEYIDPEFAQYAFTIGESVEVHLDGQWWQGAVETKDETGEVRVRFESTGEILRLHPLADMIRPVALRRVG